MGGSPSKILREDLEAYKQLTYFTEKEIFNCLEIFSALVSDEILGEVDSINDDKCKVVNDKIVENVKELKENPFGYRLCQIFSQGRKEMVFEEFLDMMSVLSETAPPQVQTFMFSQINVK